MILRLHESPVLGKKSMGPTKKQAFLGFALVNPTTSSTLGLYTTIVTKLPIAAYSRRALASRFRWIRSSRAFLALSSSLSIVNG